MRLGPGWTEGQGRGVGQVGPEREGVRGHPEPLAESPLQVRGPRGGWLAFPGAPLGVSSRDRGTRELGVPQASVAGSAPSTPLLADWLQTGSVFKLCFSLSLSLTSIFHRPGPRSRGQVGALRPCELLPRPRRGRARHRVDRRWRYLRPATGPLSSRPGRAARASGVVSR